MTGLLRLLRAYADAVESDLSHYHHIDYRDRWRFDAEGHRRLTLRMIAVRIRHLPANSATTVALGGSGWTLTDHLIADISGRPYPDLSKGSDPRRDKALRAARARASARQRAIDAGEIT